MLAPHGQAYRNTLCSVCHRDPFAVARFMRTCFAIFHLLTCPYALSLRGLVLLAVLTDICTAIHTMTVSVWQTLRFALLTVEGIRMLPMA